MQYAVAVVPALMAAAQAFPNLPRQGNATAAPDVYVTTTVTAVRLLANSSEIQEDERLTSTAHYLLPKLDRDRPGRQDLHRNRIADSDHHRLVSKLMHAQNKSQVCPN